MKKEKSNKKFLRSKILISKTKKKINNQKGSTRDRKWKAPQISNFSQKQQNRICGKQTEDNK